MHYSKVIKICIILAVLLFGGWKYFVFLEQNGCLDEGNVWDYNENRCREDCLAWNEINGCIKLTDEQMMYIFSYTQNGVDALQSFREEREGDVVNTNVTGVQGETE